MKLPDTRVTCRCGKGKVSAWDGKCGHCRTRKEQRAHERGGYLDIYGRFVPYDFKGIGPCD
jgi:hypothetical protein